jgi:acyl-CoA synthetase (AMP-forming)/AMP-acid ligase II
MILAGILDELVSAGAGESPAIVHEHTVWSFADLLDRSAAIARATTAGLPTGATVAVLGANHPDTVAAYYGVPSSGRVLTFLNHRLSEGEILSQLDRSAAGILLASPEQARRMSPHLPALPVIEFGAALPDAAASWNAKPDDPAWLLFTSGTTGTPKGALLSHRSLAAAIASSSAARPLPDDDVFAFPFPLCHVAGYNVLRNHDRGRPVVLLDGFSADGLVAAIAEHRVTSVSLAATMLAQLLDLLESDEEARRSVATLRTISYGASPMPVELLRRTDGLLSVELSQGFGMTELSGNAIFLDAAAHRRGFEVDPSILSCAGVPGPGVAVRLVDLDDVEVPVGQVGEICVAGEQVMLHYLDDPVATEHALRGGWMHTGDLGRIRADGLLEVVDRLKDVIVTGGENVASLEVERAISAVCPEVRQVAVIGVPDPTWGENVCACVALAPERPLDIDVLAGRLAGSLAGFKTPRHLVVLDDLPLTHSGKPAKAELRRLVGEQPELLGPRRSSRG